MLSEATCVAVEGGGDESEVVIKAFGDEARLLSGRAAHNTRIVNPVCEGEIVHPNLMAELMKYFLAKIEVNARKARSTEVLFIVPCSATPASRAEYSAIARECGIGRVYFTRTPYAAVMGHGVTVTPTTPVFCVDVGYGKTDIAAFSLDGIISGFTLNLGGGNIDVHILDLLSDNFSVKIGALSAERLKNTVGSLLEDDNKVTVVDGRNNESGAPTSLSVNSSQLEEVIKLYVDKIIEYTRAVLSDLPAEVSSAVVHDGIYLSGGLVAMDGFGKYFADRLGIKTNVSEEPTLASVIGGCTILSSSALCSKLVTLD